MSLDVAALDVILLNDALFEVFGEVGADFSSSTFGGYLSNIVLNHYLHQLLKARLIRVPAEFSLSLGGIAPEVDNIGGAVEIWGDSYYDVSN